LSDKKKNKTRLVGDRIVVASRVRFCKFVGKYAEGYISLDLLYIYNRVASTRMHILCCISMTLFT
jgi:hypothetical protein